MFFKVVLPNDRSVFIPIKEYLGWQRRNYVIAVLSWMFIFTSIAGIYAYSYMQNISVIGDIAYVKKYKNDFKNKDLTSRIILLDKLRLDIIKIDNSNENILLPSISFKQSQTAEKILKQLFLNDFDNEILQKFISNMDRSINKINSKTPSKEVVSYVGFIIDSINVLQQVLDKKKEINVSKYFYHYSEEILFQENNRVESDISHLFTNDYISYLKWIDNDDLIKEKIALFQSHLTNIVDKKGKNLHWLTDSISGSLTIKGREILIKNIDELVKTMKDDKKIKENLVLFWKWYDERFYYRWKNFAFSFNNAEKFLKANINNQNTLYSMTSDTNPYFKFIKTMAKEFKAYKSVKRTPSWAKSVIELGEIMSVAADIRNSKESVISEVKKEKDKLIANVEKRIDKDLKIRYIKSATLLNKYIDDLIKLSVVVDKKKSHQQFKHSTIYNADSDFIYGLIAGPKDYIIDYSIEQMNSVLNTQWENMVLGSIPLATETNLLVSLFDKDKGLVWKYMQKQLNPFVTLNQYGYNIKKVSGFKLDIAPSFLRYINSGINLLGVYKPQYSVQITTLPFDTNQEAKIEANFVNLRLICAKKDYILENNNYKFTKIFNWLPSKCGDTVLSFGFNNFIIQKTYRGENGFLNFLKDFRDGTHTFEEKDFDISTPELKQHFIKWIKVSYNISGEGDILRLLDKTPYEVPKKVTGIK